MIGTPRRSENENIMNDSLITNDTNFDFTAIPENLKLNLMALANLENSIGESYATIAKQIISEFPNISDDDANSLITDLFLYYAQSRFRNCEYVYNQNFSVEEIPEYRVIYYFYNLDVGSFKRKLQVKGSLREQELIIIYNKGIAAFQNFKRFIKRELGRKKLRLLDNQPRDISMDEGHDRANSQLENQSPNPIFPAENVSVIEELSENDLYSDISSTIEEDVETTTSLGKRRLESFSERISKMRIDMDAEQVQRAATTYPTSVLPQVTSVFSTCEEVVPLTPSATNVLPMPLHNETTALETEQTFPPHLPDLLSTSDDTHTLSGEQFLPSVICEPVQVLSPPAPDIVVEEDENAIIFSKGGGRRVVPSSPATPLDRIRRNKFGYNQALSNTISAAMEKLNLKDDPKRPLYLAASELRRRLQLFDTFYGVYSTLPTLKGECVGIYYGTKVAKSKATKEQLNSLFVFDFNSKMFVDGYDHVEQRCHSFLPYVQDALGVPGFSNNIYSVIKDGLVYFYSNRDLRANEEYLWERDPTGEFYKTRKNLLPYSIWQQAEHVYFKATVKNNKQKPIQDINNDIVNKKPDDDDIVDSSEDDMISVVSFKNITPKRMINLEVDPATKTNLRRIIRLLDQITLCSNLIISSPVATSCLDAKDASNDKYYLSLIYLRNQLIDVNSDIMKAINSINSQKQFDAFRERVLKKVDKAKEAIDFAKSFLDSLVEVRPELNISEKYQWDMMFSLKNVNMLYYHNIVSKTWCKMNSLQWQNLCATTSSGYPIGIHYVSHETAVRLIFLIQILVEDYGFEIESILDLGVGSPYLIGSMKTIWTESVAIGIDLPEVIDVIQKKLSYGGGFEVLKQVEFESLDLTKRFDSKTKSRLQQCVVITNFIGSKTIDENVIKHILPESKCRIIMFRNKTGKFSDIHTSWLTMMGFTKYPKDIMASLEFKNDDYRIAIFSRTSEYSVPKLNVGNQTGLQEREDENVFIDEGDDLSDVVSSYKTNKRRSMGAKAKSTEVDMQVLQLRMKQMALKEKLELIDLTFEQKIEVIDLIANQDEDVRKRLPTRSGGCILCGTTMSSSFNHGTMQESLNLNLSASNTEIQLGRQFDNEICSADLAESNRIYLPDLVGETMTEISSREEPPQSIHTEVSTEKSSALSSLAGYSSTSVLENEVIGSKANSMERSQAIFLNRDIIMLLFNRLDIGINHVHLNAQYYYSSDYYREVLFNEEKHLIRIPNVLVNCYINVVLEFFYSIKLMHFYMDIAPENSALWQLKFLFNELESKKTLNQKKSVTRKFLKSFFFKIPELRLPKSSNGHQDANELFIKFFNFIGSLITIPISSVYADTVPSSTLCDQAILFYCQSRKIPGNFNIFNELFNVVCLQKLTCEVCGSCSEKWINLSEINLEVPYDVEAQGIQLRSLLHLHFAPEKVLYNCEECMMLNLTHTKEVFLVQLPPILRLTLSRFKNDSVTKKCVMNSSRVNFNRHDCKNLQEFGIQSMSSLYSYDSNLSSRSTDYVLHSFYYFEKYGTEESGHYRYILCNDDETFQLVSDWEIYNIPRSEVVLPNEENVHIHEEQLGLLRALESSSNDVDINILEHTQHIGGGVYSLFYCVS